MKKKKCVIIGLPSSLYGVNKISRISGICNQIWIFERLIF